MTNDKQLTLHEKALKAAMTVSGGDLRKTFTVEDILVQAWKEDPTAWGLRGHEKDHPDSNKLYTKTDGKDGIVTKGWLKNVGPRTYQITEAGLAKGLGMGSGNEDLQGKLERQTQDSVLRHLEHPAFISWLRDPESPKKFRDAGLFWGIAPGTPAKAIRARIVGVESTLQTALTLLQGGTTNEIVKERGSKYRFTRQDIERCLEFQAVLKQRFARDLKILDPTGLYA